MKFNRVLCILSVISVFSSGMVSCAPDKKKSAPSIRLPAPQIVRGDEKPLEWKEFTAKVSPELDDRSYLQLTQVVPAEGIRLSVNSQCGVSERSLSFVTSFDGPDRIHIKDIVPTEALLYPEKPFLCRVEIVATNKGGSSQIFPPLDFKFQSKINGQELSFRRDFTPISATALALELPMSEWQRYSLVTDKNISELALECEFHRIVIQARGDGLVNLPEFDLIKAIPRGKMKGGPSRVPQQFCRVIATSKKSNRSYSPLLKVRFPMLKTEAKFTPAVAINRWGWISFGISEIKNLEALPIQLELPATNAQKLEMFHVVTTEGYVPISLSIQFAFLDNKDAKTITVAPGESVRVEILILNKYSCRIPIRHPDYTQAYLAYFAQGNVGPLAVDGASIDSAFKTTIAPFPEAWKYAYWEPHRQDGKFDFSDLKQLKLKEPCEVQHN